MVIWVSVAVFLAVAVGFMLYDSLVLGGVSDGYALFDSVMAVVTVLLLVGWVYVLCDVFEVL